MALFAADAFATNGASLGPTGPLPPLLTALAIDPVRVEAGEWWRLATAGFVHFDLLHILFNMLALRQVGTFVERWLAPARFAVVYGVALIGGDLAAYATTVGTPAVSAGASGAIIAFGAMVLLALAVRADRAVLQSAATVILLTLFNGFTHAGISNAAHVGGLVSGAAAMWLISRLSPSPLMRDVGRRAGELIQQRQTVTPPPRAEPAEVNWPASTPESIVIGIRRSTAMTHVALAAVCIVGAAYIGYLMFGAQPPSDPGVPLLAIGLLLAAALQFGLTPSHARLTLTRRGLVEQGAFLRRSIAWTDVERFFVAAPRTPGRTTPAAAFTLAPAYVYAHPGQSWRGVRSVGTQRLAGFAREPEDLAALLESWRVHWTRTPASFAEDLPRDRVLPAGLLAGAIVVLLVPLGIALATTHDVGPVEDLRSLFPAGQALVRVAPRELVLRGSDLPLQGYTADHDRDVTAELYERVFLPTRNVSYSTIVLDVERTQTLLSVDDLARVNCADSYTWKGTPPKAESLTVPVIRVAARGCRFVFSDGERAISYTSIDRNIEVDVLVFVANSIMSDSAAAADARQIAQAQLDRIDRLAPPR